MQVYIILKLIVCNMHTKHTNTHMLRASARAESASMMKGGVFCCYPLSPHLALCSCRLAALAFRLLLFLLLLSLLFLVSILVSLIAAAATAAAAAAAWQQQHGNSRRQLKSSDRVYQTQGAFMYTMQASKLTSAHRAGPAYYHSTYILASYSAACTSPQQ
jgi:hypothetical protein